LENIQGYEIEKSVLFENNQGFALGHNPAAPQPYVTWQFTENEGGVRDYYWGIRTGNGRNGTFPAELTIIKPYSKWRKRSRGRNRADTTAIILPSAPLT